MTFKFTLKILMKSINRNNTFNLKNEHLLEIFGIARKWHSYSTSTSCTIKSGKNMKILKKVLHNCSFLSTTVVN